MADVVQNTQQEFWRSPTVLAPLPVAPAVDVPAEIAGACAECGTEFMIGAHFCHACGRHRPVAARKRADGFSVAEFWARSMSWAVAQTRSGSTAAASTWRKIPFPAWMQYLHFHEIQRWIGLPTASLIAFIVGLGCVAGAVGVSLFYKASNLAEFQAIQMWRVEWLLGATASFVAGILLKKPDSD